MGAIVTAVCTVAAMTGQMTIYQPTGNFTYTYIVQGASCGWNVNFGDDPGALVEVFNNTGNGHVLEQFQCITTSSGCTTNYMTFGGTPGQYYTQEFEEFNITTGLEVKDELNFTYILVSPAPVAPQPIYVTNNSYSVVLQTSQYSAVYGYALIGCIVSAGPSPYMAADLPNNLSPTQSQNTGLPYTSYVIYTSQENANYTIPLSFLNVGPNAIVDLYFVCYNGAGKSYPAVRYGTTTSATLPIPAPKPVVYSSTGVSSSSSSAGVNSVRSSSSSSSSGAAAVIINNNGNSDAGSGRSLSGGAIAGIVIGSVVGAAVIVLVLVALCLGAGGRRAKKNTETDNYGQNNSRYSRENDQSVAGSNMEMGEVTTNE